MVRIKSGTGERVFGIAYRKCIIHFKYDTGDCNICVKVISEQRCELSKEISHANRLVKAFSVEKMVNIKSLLLEHV